MPVDVLSRRATLLSLASERERTHPQPQHRYADPRLDHLLDADVWLVALDRDERPIALAAIPVDGEWALLSYLRSLESSEEASAARYLLTDRLVERLAELGVRHLLDERSPFGLPNGLRHFQRMLGWRIRRVRVMRSACG